MQMRWTTMDFHGSCLTFVSSGTHCETVALLVPPTVQILHRVWKFMEDCSDDLTSFCDGPAMTAMLVKVHGRLLGNIGCWSRPQYPSEFRS